MEAEGWKRIGLVTVVGALIGLPGPGRAVTLCLPDLPAAFLAEIQIPLGCELIDCCPGCPAAGPIDARVRLDGEAVQRATLALRGGGHGEEVVTIARGETWLPRVARAGSEGRPRESALSISLDPSVWKRWERESASARPGTVLGTVSLTFEQLLGTIVVNASALSWTALACPPLQPCDQIAQTGNTDGDRSVILMDARRQPGANGCSDDEVLRATETAQVGSVLRPAGCRSEVGVFSEGQAMTFREEVTDWRDACGDVVPVKLEPMLELPVKAWIAVSNLDSLLWWGEPDPKVVVKEDFADAAQLYDENKTGIAFDWEPREVEPEGWALIKEKLADTPVLDLLLEPDVASAVCSLTDGLESIGFRDPDRLNVYYLPLPFTGMICDDDRNVIFVGLVKKPGTLAHEFGHALSLLGPGGHPNDLPGFEATNVMWVRDSTPRNHFSLGQAFRMNVDETSRLNVMGVRQGHTRRCLPDLTSEECPAPHLDWVRP